MTINDSSGLKVQLLSDQLMTTEEIQTIKEALKQARFKYWNEKENRTELVAILSKNVEFGEFDQISMQKEHPIYRLLLDCKLKSEDILFHCNSLSLNEPLINWILQRFENLTEGYLWACENNHVEVIKFLLNESESRGININAKDENGNTGLHLSVNQDAKLLAHFLNATGIDVNIKNADGNTIFQLLCANGNEDGVKLFLYESRSKGIDVNAKGIFDISEFKLKEKNEIEERERWPIIGKWFLDIIGKTGFHLVCEKGSPSLVSLFLSESIEKGIEVNATGRWGNTGFHFVCQRGRQDLVAAFLDQATECSYLIDLNAKNLYGSSGFHLACEKGCIETVELFLTKAEEKRINLNAKDLYGRSGFHLVCENGSLDLIKLFLKEYATRRIDLMAKNKFGDTGFNLLFEKRSPEFLSLFLNECNRYGVKENDINVIELKKSQIFYSDIPDRPVE